MQQNDKIKKGFSSKLSNFEPNAPANMWERINQNLPPVEKTPTHKITFKKAAVLVANIAALLILGFIFLNKDNDIANQLTSDTPVIEHHRIVDGNKIRVREKTDDISSEAGKTATGKTLYAHSLKEESLKAVSEPKDAINNQSDDDTENDTVVSQQEPTGKTPAPAGQNDPDKEKKEKETVTLRQLGQEINSPYIDIRKKKKKRGISISLDGHSSFAKQDDSRAAVPQLFLKYASMNQSDGTEANGGGNVASAVSKKDLIKMDHGQPVSIGLKINKELNDYLSIEAGVVYTYLSSKIKPARNSSITVEGKQKFHYIGIPVSLNYTFARLEKFEFYVSGGGMIQKDVSGTLEGDQEIRNIYVENTTTTIKDDISQDNLQFSLIANAGVSYPIYNKLNVFATVGGAYYFDAHNEHQTIYSDKKFQLDINAGFKIKF